MCGEKKSFANSIEMELGSPPHVRGKAFDGIRGYFAARITPACAGKSVKRNEFARVERDHPRMCGEKSDRKRVDTEWFRITPACAGKSA